MPPAARITDIHACPIPVHGPNPIIAPCCPTVIIGGQPAARVTDKSLCTGEIITGSDTVFIGFQRAARIGDMTSHGGLIVTGWMTVIIGGDNSRHPTLQQAQSHLLMLDQLPPSEEVERMKANLKADMKLLMDALVAQDVYRKPGAPGGPPPGVKRLSDNPADLPEALRNAVWDDPESGFHAELYQLEDGQIVLAFEGTTTTSLAEIAKDMITNIKQGCGWESEQYRQAINLADAVKTVYGDQIHLVGHSLGGGLASAASVVTGLKATVFNAAGVHADTVERFQKNLAPAPSLITNHRVEGELLTSLQEDPLFLLFNPVGIFFPKTSLVLGAGLSYAMPDAIGVQSPLPALNSQGQATYASSYHLHGMEYVLNGVSKNIQIDTQTTQDMVNAHFR